MIHAQMESVISLWDQLKVNIYSPDITLLIATNYFNPIPENTYYTSLLSYLSDFPW